MGPRAARREGVNVVCLLFLFLLFDSTARQMRYTPQD
jgi:hypothetical protein